jgi:hypothetical protein
VGAFAGDDGKDKEKERAEIRKMSQETLTCLHKAQPAAQTAVEKAYGYAVFSNPGVKILLAGSGKGIAIVNQIVCQSVWACLYC